MAHDEKKKEAAPEPEQSVSEALWMALGTAVLLESKDRAGELSPEQQQYRKENLGVIRGSLLSLVPERYRDRFLKESGV